MSQFTRQYLRDNSFDQIKSQYIPLLDARAALNAISNKIDLLYKEGHATSEIEEMETLEDTLSKNVDETFNQILNVWYDARRPNLRIKNEWFLNFLNSFTVCKSKRISAKQAEVFKRNLHDNDEENKNSRGLHYHGIINGFVYKVADFGNDVFLDIYAETTL